MTVKSVSYPLTGGLDQVTPANKVSPGRLRGASNYEGGVNGGCRRIDGLERYDGRLRPSAAAYWVLNFDAGTTAIASGDLVGDAASPTVQGEALEAATVSSGAWATNDAAGYVVLGAVNGVTDPDSFADNDALYVGAGQVAIANGTATKAGASNDTDDDTWTRAAMELLRADILVVPGSGQLRGVKLYKGTVYAWRDNAGGTACDLYQATSTGWSQIDLSVQGTLAYTSGSTAPSVGDTLSGQTSGATLIVTRVQLDSGAWGSGTAVGTFYYRAVTGTWNASEVVDNDTTAATDVATTAGLQVAIALTKGGTYRIDEGNFTGHAGTKKLYGVDGKNLAFEFDGTSLIQITTGMTTDTPSHVMTHKKQLHLGFSGGSLQQSSLGDPHTTSAVTGAQEIGTADEITGLERLPGDVLLVGDRQRTYILSGSDGSWSLSDHSRTTGVIANSLQRAWTALFCDDRGLTSLMAVQAYGNFEDNTFSQLVNPLIQAKKDLITASCLARDKNQYRLFFSDNTALYVTFDDRRVSAIMPVDLGRVVRCIDSAEDNAGNEQIYFGSDDGYIYHLDQGNNLDGTAITAFLTMHFNNVGSPERRKRFRRLTLEVDATLDVNLKVTPTFSYDDGETAGSLEHSSDMEGAGGSWNIDNWNEFVWSGAGVARASVKLDGTGDNLGVTIYSEGSHAYENAHTIHGATLQFSYRRLNR